LLLSTGPNIEHLHEINEALLRQEQIEMTYWSAKEKIQKQYRLHPVGLVKQGLFFWLLAVKDEHALGDNSAEWVQSFRVNRILSVARRLQETVARGLPTLSAALDGGALQFFQTGMIRLRLRFAASAAGRELCNNYREAPLSQDQEISMNLEQMLELRATVRHSRQLVWMLQGQANLVRVVAPPDLRNEVHQYLAAAVAFQQ
jgi:predicted DNA-binding transcriptional regulator YafY